MTETKQLLERARDQFPPPSDVMAALVRRRDRKQRNKRIAAGVVGIAVFVAAVWIVTSGLSLDRSTPAVPGSETGPTQTAPPSARASAAPDVVSQEQCSGDAISRLELTSVGRNIQYMVGIRVRYEVHRSPVGHSWRIAIRPFGGGPHLSFGAPVFRGIRVAGDSGHLAVQLHVLASQYRPRFSATALDTQTGQLCSVDAGL